jgi:hypothetical protein
MDNSPTLTFVEAWALPDEAWLKPKDAATLLSLSTSRLAQFRCLGEGPPYSKRGNIVRYNVGLVKQWLAGAAV